MDGRITYPVAMPPTRLESLDLPARPTDADSLKGWLGGLLEQVWPDRAHRLRLRMSVPPLDADYQHGAWNWWSAAGVALSSGVEPWPGCPSGLWPSLLLSGIPRGLQVTRLTGEYLAWRMALAASCVEVDEDPVIADGDGWRGMLPLFDGHGRPVVAEPLAAAAESGATDIGLFRWSALHLAGEPPGIQAGKVWRRQVAAAEPSALATAQSVHETLRIISDLGGLQKEPQRQPAWEMH